MVAEGPGVPLEGGSCREEEVLPLLREHGRSPTSFLSLHLEKSIFQTARGCLAYRATRFGDVILGEPIARPTDARPLLREFVARSRRQTVAVAVTPTGASVYEDVGFQTTECGSEAVTELVGFSLDDPRHRNARRGARHASRAGLFVEAIPPGSRDALRLAPDFAGITEDWLRSRKTGHLGFIVGDPFLPGFQECWYFLARTAERIEGFAMFYPVYPERAVYMDITRRRTDSPNGTMDLLLTQAFRTLAGSGVRRAYLGMVPCVLSREVPPTIETALMQVAFQRLNGLYPMRSEHFFKDKLATRWDPRFAAFHPHRSLRGMLAVYEALWPDGAAGILRHKLRPLRDGHENPPVPSSIADRRPAALWGSRNERAASKAWPAIKASVPRSIEDTK
jgi:phosphatidylglycerol lysyltransferase